MKLLTAQQLLKADAYTIANEPISSLDLMERASKACVVFIEKLYPCKKTSFHIFCGNGNNAGDGLAIARLLREHEYNVIVYTTAEKTSSDERNTNYNRYAESFESPILIKNTDVFPQIKEGVIIDALFGIGLSRPVEDLYKSIILWINTLSLTVISIDLPSGMPAEPSKNAKAYSCVKASFTLSFELPKLNFLMPETGVYVGKLKIIPIGLHQKFIENIRSSNYFITKEKVSSIYRHRNKFSHKGTFGHALLVVGSKGSIGAAILASKACMRSGAGLVSVHTPQCGYTVLQTAVPEAMVCCDIDPDKITDIVLEKDYRVIGIGCGIGKAKETCQALFKLLQTTSSPMVLDADAINILSEHPKKLYKIPKNSILTPHPKEFERMAGKSQNDSQKIEQVLCLCKKYECYIVLKGAHTLIATPSGESYFNSSGNAGMATGGSGDVLTGILCGLLSCGYKPLEACITGVFLHGLSGDKALKNQSVESLTAGDIITNMGKAFKYIQKKP